MEKAHIKKLKPRGREHAQKPKGAYRRVRWGKCIKIRANVWKERPPTHTPNRGGNCKKMVMEFRKNAMK